MKRYYISPLIGSGTRADPYRVAIASYPNIAYSSIIPTDPVTGAPTATWAICIVDAADHTALLADSSLFSFPNATPDTQISTLSNQERNRMRNGLSQFGLDPNLVNQSNTMRDLVNSLGKLLEPTFDPDKFNATAL